MPGLYGNTSLRRVGQRPAGEGGRHLAVLQHRLAGDDHAVNPGRVLVWLGERGVVRNGARIEHGNVGDAPSRQQARGQTYPRRCAGAEVIFRTASSSFRTPSSRT